MFGTTVNGAPRRVITTAGKDGMLRAIDRDTHRVLYETAITTRENADIPVSFSPLRACPGVLGGSQWNGPAYNAGTNALYAPAVDWCTTFSSFEQVRYIPGRNYMGGKTDLDPPSKAQGWRREMEVSLAASDGGGGDDDGGESRADRRADGRLRRLRRAKRQRALPLQHRRPDRRRCRDLLDGWAAVHRGRIGEPFELLDRAKPRLADDRRLRVAR
jgi:hypothetical protein